VTKPDLSVLVTTRSGSERLQTHLPATVDALELLGISFEIVVVDDGAKRSGFR